MGYKPHAFIENSSFWLDHVHPNDRETMLKGLSAQLETGGYTHEYRFLHADGSYRWMHDRLHLVRDAQGHPLEIMGMCLDVTERKRTEDALRAAEKQFRGLAEQSIAGIYIIQEGRFAYVNPRYVEIFGYDSAGELIGRDPLLLVAENDRTIAAERLRHRLEGEAATDSIAFTGVRNDGTTIDVEVQGARATHRGRPAVIGLMEDVSEKERAEEEARRYAEQLKTAL